MTTSQQSLVAKACDSILHMEATFTQALPPNVSVQKFMRTVMTAIQKDDIAAKLNEGKVDRRSLFTECTKAAQDGLVLDDREAALVTFFNRDKGLNEVKYMPMVAGLLKKARGSKQIVSISAHVIKENDHFEYVLGDDEKIIHRLPKLGDPRGKMIGAYAIAKLASGGTQRVIMDLDQINKIKGCAKTTKIWDKWPDEQAEKSALRKLCKRLPMDSDSLALFEHDNEGYDLDKEHHDEHPIEQDISPAKETRAAAAVKAQAEDVSDVDMETGEVIDEPPPVTSEDDFI